VKSQSSNPGVLAQAEAIRTRLRKRLRVLKAALTQEWHEHRCCEPDCRQVWVCQGQSCRPWPDDRCQECDIKAVERFNERQRGKVWGMA
jgi:hypothetical protein